MITALGIALAGLGAAMIWSGITDEKLKDVALELVTGQPRPPKAAAQEPGIFGAPLGPATNPNAQPLPAAPAAGTGSRPVVL